MNYQMKLENKYFNKILNKTKTLEIRLFDEKRQKLKINDVITFINKDNLDIKIDTKVIAIYKFKTFSELFRSKSLFSKCDFKVAHKEAIDIMHQIYSVEDEKRYGVVAIEIEVL